MSNSTDTIAAITERAKEYAAHLAELTDDSGFNKDDIAEVVGQDIYDGTKQHNNAGVAVVALGYEIFKAR